MPPKPRVQKPDPAAEVASAVPEGAPALESPEQPAPPPYVAVEQPGRVPAHAPGQENL